MVKPRSRDCGTDMAKDTFAFEKLAVWRKAVGFASFVYKTTDSFPAGERYGLVSQMRRAAVSVSSNLAEGTSRNSRLDFARFVEIAYGSLLEVLSQATVAKELGYLEAQRYQDLRTMVGELARMLSGLRSSLRAKP